MRPEFAHPPRSPKAAIGLIKVLRSVILRPQAGPKNLDPASRGTARWHTSAFCLLPTAYCLLPTAYCLLPTEHQMGR